MQKASISAAYRWTQRDTVKGSAWSPRSLSNSSTSRYDKEKRRYQPTARRMTSGSNCLHLQRPEYANRVTRNRSLEV